jgi:hypothetical protein
MFFPRWMAHTILVCSCISIVCSAISIHDKITGKRLIPYRLHLTADTSDAKAATTEATKIAH